MTAVSFDLRDRVAVITGGSRGLGLEIARAYAAGRRRRRDRQPQARRLRAGRRRDPSRPAAGRCIGVACHVGHWQDCDALADAAYAHFGRVDVLVNNAGMSPLYDALTDVSEDAVRQGARGEPARGRSASAR